MAENEQPKEVQKKVEVQNKVAPASNPSSHLTFMSGSISQSEPKINPIAPYPYAISQNKPDANKLA